MPKDTHPPDLILTSDVAKMLGIHVATVVRRAQTDELPYVVKIPGKTGAYLFDRKVIERIKSAA
jgi:hypothetical protein